MLQHGATVDCLNSQRATPLYVASLRGDELTVDLLLAAKASVDRPIPLDASTPLVAAARNGHADCVAKLLDARAAVDHRGAEGASSLFFAAQSGHDDVSASY